MKKKKVSTEPDAHLDALVADVRAVTQAWGVRHDMWNDSGFNDPLKHYDSEPSSGEPILTLWSDGTPGRCLNTGDELADELAQDLERLGVFIELDDAVTANYFLIDDQSELQREFDRLAQWKWTCRLIEADTADVSGDIYTHFARHPEDLHRLSPRAFEELISSVFTAQGWKTKIGPGTGDKGVDVRMWLESPLGDSLTLVQAKRYAPHKPIHLEAVAALEAHCNREDASGLFITTSRYLPGVRDWASRNQRIELAQSDDLQTWCQEASQEAIKARAHATALESFSRLIREIRQGVGTSRVVVCSQFWNHYFAVVVKENNTGAILVRIPSKIVAGDLQRGLCVPVLDGTILEDQYLGKSFRAIRKGTGADGYYWGQQRYYVPWTGQPMAFDSPD